MSTAVATEFPARMYINGVWCDARGGQTLAVINPADESVLAEVAWGGREDAERAIEAAAGRFPSGARRPSTTAPRSSRRPRS